jgi:hypothetical protein
VQGDPIDSIPAAARDDLARAMRRVGRLGFWAQVVLAIVPLAIGGAAFLVSERIAAPGTRFNLLAVLAVASLLILLFTTFWFWRYPRVADRLSSGMIDGRRLMRTVWTGLTASAAGIVLSIVVMAFEVGYLLFRFLEMPQGGVPVIQTTGEGASWISAIDMLSLLALVFTIAAEIITLVLGLVLLGRLWALAGGPAAAHRKDARIAAE